MPSQNLKYTPQAFSGLLTVLALEYEFSPIY